MPNTALINKITQQADSLNDKTAQELLKIVIEIMGNTIVHSNSFSIEDITIMHMLYQIAPKFKSFTLDTGRLNPETYNIMARLQEKYDLDLEITFPDQDKIEKMVNEKGINLFYESIENRHLCCHLRKVEPLKRVLEKYSGWITGLRQEQSVTREDVKKVELDDAHNNIVKINPLADWSFDQVMDYVKKNGIPYNQLYDQGYRSIGCAPCTRAIRPEDPERAGRWWWEQEDTKECGIHLK